MSHFTTEILGSTGAVSQGPPAASTQGTNWAVLPAGVLGSLTVRIHLVNHVLQFGLGGVLPQGPHHGAKLLGGDGPIAVLVEEGEGLLELCRGPEKQGTRTQRCSTPGSWTPKGSGRGKEGVTSAISKAHAWHPLPAAPDQTTCGWRNHSLTKPDGVR